MLLSLTQSYRKIRKATVAYCGRIIYSIIYKRLSWWQNLKWKSEIKMRLFLLCGMFFSFPKYPLCLIFFLQNWRLICFYFWEKYLYSNSKSCLTLSIFNRQIHKQMSHKGILKIWSVNHDTFIPYQYLYYYCHHRCMRLYIFVAV